MMNDFKCCPYFRPFTIILPWDYWKQPRGSVFPGILPHCDVSERFTIKLRERANSLMILVAFWNSLLKNFLLLFLSLLLYNYLISYSGSQNSSNQSLYNAPLPLFLACIAALGRQRWKQATYFNVGWFARRAAGLPKVNQHWFGGEGLFEPFLDPANRFPVVSLWSSRCVTDNLWLTDVTVV